MDDSIIRCTRCILPDSTPGISFDEYGVCNICNSYHALFFDWDAVSQKKEEEFRNILLAAKELKRPYDCLIPLSGGKDSTYALYVASKVYGLNCLSVTFDNGFLSEQAKVNIQNATQATGTDHLIYHLDQEKALDIFKIFLTKTGDFCSACMRGINHSIESAVMLYRIPLVIKGSGRRVQYVSQTGISSSNSAPYFRNVLKGEPELEQSRQLCSGHRTYEHFKTGEMLFKLLRVSPVTIMRFQPLFIGMYDYIYRPYPEIIEIITREMGWSQKDEKFEHLDCEFHDIPFYIQSLRLRNITPETLHSSGLVRQGIMTRDEAMELDARLAGGGPPKALQTLLNRMDLTEEEFVRMVSEKENAPFVPLSEKYLSDLYKKFILKDK